MATKPPRDSELETSLVKVRRWFVPTAGGSLLMRVRKDLTANRPPGRGHEREP